jgi:lipopolysaccharide/colanic/teichoic acid biosynthesis glycosyltransferase
MQVSGKNGTTYDEMVQLDLLYSRRIAPLTDLTILYKTIPVVRAQVKELPLADHVE